NRGQFTFAQTFTGFGINFIGTYGHGLSDSAITVGAVAWYDTPQFNNPQPTPTEGFSAYGPGVRSVNSAGVPIPPQILNKPDLAGVDGNNVSFAFGSPPGAGNPANNQPGNNNAQYNFFGTSDSAPNVAAVAALMKQLSPRSSPSDIKAGLINSTIPVNGTAKGSWDKQGGFGLVQATTALQAVDNLRVLATNPA